MSSKKQTRLADSAILKKVKKIKSKPVSKFTDDNQIRDWLEENGDEEWENLRLVDGHANAFLGLMSGVWADDRTALVYSRDQITRNLINDGMTYEEAVEFFDFNIAGAWVGKHTPIFLQTP